jgi:hypothetical protein
LLLVLHGGQTLTGALREVFQPWLAGPMRFRESLDAVAASQRCPNDVQPIEEHPSVSFSQPEAGREATAPDSQVFHVDGNWHGTVERFRFTYQCVDFPIR